MNKFQENLHYEILNQIDFVEQLNLPWSKKGSCYVCYAYEYFNMGCENEGIEILSKIPIVYFDKDMITELRENEEFLEISLMLLDLMVKSKLVEENSYISFILEMIERNKNV